MNSIHGYKLQERIHITKYSDVYNGIREADQLPVVIKISHAEEIAQAQARAEKELAVLLSLEGKGVVKGIEIKQYGEHPALILERFPGFSLDEYIKENTLSIKQFLEIALQISKVINWIHQHGIIHKDIKPSNILFNSDTNTVCITDFGTAASLDLNADGPNASLQGSLPYISPEQTGRMGKFLDFRSDLYSTGVTFYELITGQLPFNTKSSSEMIHAHLAVPPKSVTEIKPQIPETIAKIILKLMSKAPEDRYQTAEGLSVDLHHCLQQIKTNGHITRFKLAQSDTPQLFLLPQKIYGRDLEKQVLVKRFENVCRGNTEIILLSGPPGIGKSALFTELQKPVLMRNGHFIQGKYDRLKSNVPFTGIGQTISNLVDQLLAENHNELEKVRSILINEMDSVASIMLEIAPALRLLTGPRESVSHDHAPAEIQNRVKQAFSRFIALFSSTEQPLVLFLDDLQWADTSSLMLIESIIIDATKKENNSQALLILGSYLEEELHSHHPLQQMIQRLIKIDAPITQSILQPLQLNDIEQLLGDTLHAPKRLLRPLAKLVARKTDRNPFFIHQFLKHLNSLEMFKFHENASWRWNLEEIEKAGIPDDAAGMMAAKIQRLSPDVKEILIQSSIIGCQFDLLTLSSVIKIDERQLVHALHTLVAEGLIIPLKGSFRFIHGKIQEAAAKLLPIDKAKEIHLEVGRWNLKRHSKDIHTQSVFEIVEHLNKAVSLVDKKDELVKIAQLNLNAGRKAMETAAWSAAENYLDRGLSIIEEDCWQHHYNLAFALHLEAAQAKFLTGKLDIALASFESLLQRPLKPLDTSTAYERLISLYSFLGKPEKACEIGIEAQARLGRKTTLHPSKPYLGLQLFLTLFKLWRVTPDKLRSLPEEDDEKWQALVRIIAEMGTASHMLDMNLAFSNSLWVIRNIPSKGVGPHSAAQLMSYAVLRGPVLGNLKLGYDIAQATLEINSKFGTKRWQENVKFVYNLAIKHWVDPLQDSIIAFEAGTSASLDAGDFEIASLSCLAISSCQLFVGEHLSTVDRNSKRAIQFCAQTQLPDLDILPNTCMRITAVLRDPNALEKFTEKEISKYFNLDAAKNIDIKLILPLLAGHCAMAYYLLEHYQSAFRHASVLVAAIGKLVVGVPHIIEGVLMYGLAAARILENKKNIQKRKYIKALNFSIKQLKKWNKVSTSNFEHKLLWLEAEKLRIDGNNQQALAIYLRAREATHSSRHHHLQAMIEERRGTLALTMGLEQEAAVWLKKSRDGFYFWGAKHIAKNMDEKYPTLIHSADAQLHGLSKSTTIDQENISHSLHKKANNHSILPDISNIIRTIQAITKTVNLETTLEQALNYTIQNAGAQKGSILLEKDGHLIIEGMGAVGGAFSRVHQELEVSDAVPKSIIQFVYRTGKPVVLSNACSEGLFCKDPWVSESKAKSIMCLPLIKAPNIVGILFLENNLSTDAFSLESLDILNIITSQVTIALDNARIHEERDLYTKKLEAELKQASKEAEAANQIKSNLISTLSHEIRIPMTNVFAIADLLGDTPLSEEQENYVRIIKNSGFSFLSLISDIANLSRFESSNIEIEREAFHLRQTIYEVCDIISLNAQQKALEYTLIINSKIPQNVVSSTRVLREVLLSTSNHLIDRTHIGGIHVTVNHTQDEHFKSLALFRLHSAQLQLTINEQQSYFLPPHQIQHGESRRFNKIHASLFISKQLLLALGGNIWLESKPEQGTSILFTIPLENMEPYKVPSIPEIHNLRAAYVEPNQNARTAMKEILESLGAEVESYKSIQELLESNENLIHHFPIIFLSYPAYPLDINQILDDLINTYKLQVVLVCPILEKLNLNNLEQKWNCKILTKPVQEPNVSNLLLQILGRKPAKRLTQKEAIQYPASADQHSNYEILLVEDNRDHQIVAQQILQKAGYHCTIADSGSQAVDKFKDQKWDLILMDCELPELNGLEATRKIRDLEDQQNPVTIVAMTSNVLQEDKTRCLDAGMNDYLAKPFNQSSLLNMIAKYSKASEGSQSRL